MLIQQITSWDVSVTGTLPIILQALLLTHSEVKHNYFDVEDFLVDIFGESSKRKNLYV